MDCLDPSFINQNYMTSFKVSIDRDVDPVVYTVLMTVVVKGSECGAVDGMILTVEGSDEDYCNALVAAATASDEAYNALVDSFCP